VLVYCEDEKELVPVLQMCAVADGSWRRCRGVFALDDLPLRMAGERKDCPLWLCYHGVDGVRVSCLRLGDRQPCCVTRLKRVLSFRICTVYA
jgi:hypothetical protein